MTRPELRREAVVRLEAAATAAQAASANVEALRHLRAALELATPDRHLDIYERMGDTTVHGDTSIEALTHALELARLAGAPPQRESCASSPASCTFHTRWQGSVAGRPSEAELEALFEEGRALVPAVTRRAAIARFRAAEAFLPFWIGAGGRSRDGGRAGRGGRQSPKRPWRSRPSARPALQSAALDGVGGNAQQRGDYAGMASSRAPAPAGARRPARV